MTRPHNATALYVLAHGAGAGMGHPFMVEIADALAARKIATLRWEFPSMAAGKARPDRPPIAEAAVRAVWDAIDDGLPRFAGGKSFGGRMTSQAQALQHLPGVRGLVFVGFPLHPAGKPAVERAAHLAQVQRPMLFLQGARDALADLGLLQGALAPLGDRATLCVFDDADHAFHVRARSGTTDAATLAALADAMAGWFASLR